MELHNLTPFTRVKKYTKYLKKKHLTEVDNDMSSMAKQISHCIFTY